MKVLAWRQGEDGRWDAEEIEGDPTRIDSSGAAIVTAVGYMPVEARGRLGIVPGYGDLRAYAKPAPRKLDPAAYEALWQAAVLEANARRPEPLGEPKREVRP